jgi:hypothetical protein
MLTILCYVGVTVEEQYNAAFGVNHVTGNIKAYAAGNLDLSTNKDANTPPATTTPPQGDLDEQTLESSFGKQIRSVTGDTDGINSYTDKNDETITDHGLDVAKKATLNIPRYFVFGKAYSKDNSMTLGYYDWHGAGAQRSYPKADNSEDYLLESVNVMDSIRIKSYVRLVRNEINHLNTYKNYNNENTKIYFCNCISDDLQFRLCSTGWKWPTTRTTSDSRRRTN